MKLNRELLKGHRSFIVFDPGSYSAGWAFVTKGRVVKHGTIKLKGEVWERLMKLNVEAEEVIERHKPEAVYVEQLVRMTHIFTHYSVASIGLAAAEAGAPCYPTVAISSWQKAVDWKAKARILEKYRTASKSEDELAAVGMALYLLKEAGQ